MGSRIYTTLHASMALCCALVAPSEAEALRRSLDRSGLLDLKRRPAHSPDGRIAFPLSLSQEEEIKRRWHGDPLTIVKMAESQLPERGNRSSLVRQVRAAIQGAGAPASSTDPVIAALPSRWEKLGDIALLAPSAQFEKALDALTGSEYSALMSALAAALGVLRIGLQGKIEPSLHRKSGAVLLWAKDKTYHNIQSPGPTSSRRQSELTVPGSSLGWTIHREQGIQYGLDVTRSMFSSGNGSEKARVASFRCEGEVVVDLYAGIGYFTLPYLV